MSITNIKKISLDLYKIYNNFLVDKKKLLNHPKMIEYLFYKPIHKVENLKSGEKILDNDFYPTRLNVTHKMDIEMQFENLCLSLYNYLDKYKEYEKLVTKHINQTKSKINFNAYLPIVLNYSSNIEKISDALFDMGTTNVFDWTFECDDEHTNACKKQPYIFNLKFKVDVYGCFFTGKKYSSTRKMFQIAIDYDSSSKKITINNYLKQYYLKKMNIHFLRLNKNSYYKSEIRNFIKKIKENNIYIIQNGLPVLRYELNIENKLVDFYNDYEYNHHLYLNVHDKHKNDGLSVSEDDNQIFSEEPTDESGTVSKDFFKNMSDGKYFFTK